MPRLNLTDDTERKDGSSSEDVDEWEEVKNDLPNFQQHNRFV